MPPPAIARSVRTTICSAEGADRSVIRPRPKRGEDLRPAPEAAGGGVVARGDRLKGSVEEVDGQELRPRLDGRCRPQLDDELLPGALQLRAPAPGRRGDGQEGARGA